MINPKVTCSKTQREVKSVLESVKETLIDCLQLGTARKWFCLTVTTTIYWKSTLVSVLLDVINIWDSCPKSGQKICPEPDLAGFAKKGQMPDLPELKSGRSLDNNRQYILVHNNNTAVTKLNQQQTRQHSQTAHFHQGWPVVIPYWDFR